MLLLGLMVLARAQEKPADLSVGQGMALLPVDRLRAPEPPVFSVTAETKLLAGLEAVEGTTKAVVDLHRGGPGPVSIGLSGSGDVTAVEGAEVGEWAVRTDAEGRRFLDVTPKAVWPGVEWPNLIRPLPNMTWASPSWLPVPSAPRKVEWTIRTRSPHADPMSVLLPAPGKAAGFSLVIELAAAPDVDLRVTKAEGLIPLQGEKPLRFHAASAALLELGVARGGSFLQALELREASLAGKLAPDGNSVMFTLTAQARSKEAGASVELLAGDAALEGAVAGDGWHVTLERKDGVFRRKFVAERAGEFPVSLAFSARVQRKGDWRTCDFVVPAGTVVPLSLAELDGKVEFDPALPVVPRQDGALWRGFLPSSGRANLAWKASREEAEGALFFSSTEITEIRVGSGLLRESSSIRLRVLQGKLSSVTLKLDGPGEILSVTGAQVLGWTVREDQGARRLDVTLNRPIEGEAELRVEAQSALGGFPVKAQPVRFTPDGALRHNGWVRVASQGSVKLEVTGLAGMMQLAPGQFPGGEAKGLRQVSVYRFPSAERSFEIAADQVLPEIGVNEVTLYEIGETDRRILATLELEIREAPLREWEVAVPEDYAVASVTGASVADFTLAGGAGDGRRTVKILFGGPVDGRQLVTLRLEKNEAAKPGTWELPVLGFPGAKSRRGFVGVVSAPGFRVTPAKTAALAEVPLTFFPKQTPGLQQAFRLREAAWTAAMKVEALGQNIQADVFHLYSLKAGAAYGSVLMNYFVVGAPATEWRIAVPEGIGNIEVTGQNAGRDWRREGNVVIVPLSRPVMGAGTVLLTFEQPMSARGGVLSPGAVRPLNVQSERGYVQVVSPLQVNHSVTRSDGPLLKLEANELPAEYRLLTSAPTLGAWQYTARDFTIDLDVKWFTPGETAEQVVDFLKLTSQISRDGQVVTDARFFVKSRSRSALRLKLPAVAKLWEARVDGSAVNAREDGADTLVPLPVKNDPNDPVEIVLRYGAQAEHATSPVLTAPVLDAPVVIGEWLVGGDENRRLVPKGGTAELVRAVQEPTGFQQIGSRLRQPAIGIAILAFSTLLLGAGSPGRWRATLAVVTGLSLVVVSLGAAVLIWKGTPFQAPALEYAAPVVAPGQEVVLKLANLAPWRAQIAWTGVAGLLLGIVLLVRGLRKRLLPLVGAGSVLVGLGVLAQRGGAPWFFSLLALAVAVLWLIPLAKRVRLPRMAPAAALLAFLLAGMPETSKAAEARPAEAVVQQWKIADGRLRGELELTVRGEAGERFLLLQPPAVLTGFQGQGLRAVKVPVEGKETYFVVLDAAGRASAQVSFEMPLARPQDGWSLPTGPAASQNVSVRWSEPGWEFFSEAATSTREIAGLAKEESGAVLALAPSETTTFVARPRRRDAAAEPARYFSEVSNLFIPGPGVVNGRHRITLRPTQGRVSELVLRVPEEFTVGDVSEGPVGSWRFDPRTRELRVAVEPAQEGAFSLTVETQRGSGTLPVDLTLSPLRVNGSAGEVGLLALAFGDEAQPDTVMPKGLSRVNAEDFDAKLLPADAKGQPLALLQRVFRYGAEDASLAVKVAAVAPELRAESKLLVSLGEDRLVFAADLAVTITRAGVFRLVLDVPENLEIESATGDALSHWTVANEGGKRRVTLHLKGRTIGRQEFAISMSGPSTGTQASWNVPRIAVRDASRETGTLVIVPERGLQVRSVSRARVSQLDPRELGEGEQVQDAMRPGALAFRLLQADWQLALGIERLDAWITAQVLHEVTLREGQLLHRAALRYRIENAAVKSLRIRIPGLDAAAAGTVRASGPGVGDLVPVEGSSGEWEIRFQRAVAGEAAVDLEYQSQSAGGGVETIPPISVDQVRQLSYFVALRAGGRLELVAPEPPRGWQRTDWAVVRTAMPQAAAGAAPGLVFRVAEAESPLQVTVKRHNLAGSLKLRVASGTLTTLLSPDGDGLTSVDLNVEVVEKGTLRLKLPKDSGLFNVLVNGEGAPLVREGDHWLFHVFPAPEGGKPASVRFVYSSAFGKKLKLEGPALDVPLENLTWRDVPLENLTWRVVVPDGWKLADHDGDFDLKEQTAAGVFRLEDYRSFVSSKRAEEARDAVALLDQANAWLASGEQDKAGQALSKASRASGLDEASNEDARVQLRQLKTQQAVLGLNTRRQKLYLDNRSEGSPVQNAQLERAANDNPVFQGNLNYDPQQYDQLMAGNTADENSALKAIANRIVAQQLAAEPAPVALDVTLPQRGTVLTFGRSVQVEGGKAMTLDLDLKRKRSGGIWLGALLCLALGGVALRPKK